MSPIKHNKKNKEDEDEDNIFTRCGVLTSRILVNLHQSDQPTKGTRLGSPNVSRERIPVQVIFLRLGPSLFKRAYRMTEASFWRLYRIIVPHIPKKKHKAKNVREDPLLTVTFLGLPDCPLPYVCLQEVIHWIFSRFMVSVILKFIIAFGILLMQSTPVPS